MTTRKEAILEAAARLFAEKGYNEASMSELAHITGVAQGTIFYHFKNKEELFLTILDDFKNQNFQRIRETYRKKRILHGGSRWCRRPWTSTSSLQDPWRTISGSFTAFTRTNWPGSTPNAVSISRPSTAVSSISSSGLFGMGQEDGSIRRIPTRKVALIIYAMVDGLVRFNTYGLYDGGVLSDELLDCCRRILENHVPC